MSDETAGNEGLIITGVPKIPYTDEGQKVWDRIAQDQPLEVRYLGAEPLSIGETLTSRLTGKEPSDYIVTLDRSTATRDLRRELARRAVDEIAMGRIPGYAAVHWLNNDSPREFSTSELSNALTLWQRITKGSNISMHHAAFCAEMLSSLGIDLTNPNRTAEDLFAQIGQNRVLLVIELYEYEDESPVQVIRDLPEPLRALVLTGFHEDMPYPIK